MKNQSVFLITIVAMSCSSPKNDKQITTNFDMSQRQILTDDSIKNVKDSAKQVFSVVQEKRLQMPTKVFRGDVGVMVYPSDKQVDSLQRQQQDDFMTAADDNMFYMSQAKDYLEMIHTSVARISTDTLLIFETESGQKFPMNMRKELWAMVIFDGVHTPRRIDITNVQKECEKYYEQNRK